MISMFILKIVLDNQLNNTIIRIKQKIIKFKFIKQIIYKILKKNIIILKKIEFNRNKK